jgi:SAM-dependent methyltransferase
VIPDRLLHNTDVCTNRYILLRLIKAQLSEHPVVAEVGVAYGGFTQVILDALVPAEFHAFDTFNLHEQDCVFGAHPSTVLGDQTHWQYYRKRFCNNTDYPNTSIFTWEGFSQEQLKLVKCDTFDFVYVDGGHSYDDVKGDIEQIKRVVKPGGVVMFDDYCTYDIIARQDFGVLQAVNEYIAEGHEVLGISLHPEGFHNIAVRA